MAPAQTTQPVVAVHDSELTRALASMTASNGTPSGGTTTGFQWWLTNWNYFVMPTSVEEALHSDGTAFAVVSDANIVSGALVSNGVPLYPIVISLASEAMLDSEIAPLTNYVAAGGFLLVGSSSFTRFTNGATRTNFAFANELGVSMVGTNLLNWVVNGSFTKQFNHRIVNHVPSGTLTWSTPSAADEINWGISPTHPDMPPHIIWGVQATTATVIAQGDSTPYLLVKPYGKGCFIYYAAIEPLLGHAGWAPGMYSYAIFRKAIEWAFENSKLPVAKLSPWPYPYDAAFMMRHDLEDYADEIAHIADSAQFEKSLGVFADYYFCTGTLRVDMPTNGYNTNQVITNLQFAATNYGATFGPHNGGLQNPNNTNLVEPNYDYWHWGTDEALDLANAITNNSIVYANGKAYALASASNSFKDIEGWLPGIESSAMRSWASPYFNGTRENSLDIQSQLGVKVTGDQKLSPYPSWVFSTQTSGKRYAMLNIPVSDWFIPGSPGVVGQAMDNPVNQHTTNSIHQLIDFYYGMGGLINLYCHTLSKSSITNATLPGPGGALPQEYLTYGMNTNLHPRLWSVNATNMYNWWVSRSNAVFTASVSNGPAGLVTTTLAVSGAGNTNAAVELLVPNLGAISGLAVKTNGTLTTTNNYRTNGQVIKIKVGTSVTNVIVSYTQGPKAQNDFYTTVTGTPLTVAAPGVLANDSPGTGGTSLSASLVGSPTNGTLSFNTNGGFTYTPTNSATSDSFTYTVNDGQATSTSATVLISVMPGGDLFFDAFDRPAGADPLTPWQAPLYYGSWTITNGLLQGTSDFGHYGYAFVSNNWTDYSVQAQVQLPAGAYGGGLGGRFNPVTGAHYAAWLYPSGILALVKFEDWNTFTTMQTNGVGTVGTNFHTLRLAFQGTQISVFYDGTNEITTSDMGNFDGSPAYTNGGVSADMWTFTTPYAMSFDNVTASSVPVANNDSYSVVQARTLTVNAAQGVLTNDTGGSGPLSAVLFGGVLHGNLNLNSDGSFTYTPVSSFVGTDSFTYQASDGITNSATAAVTINVTPAPPPVANNDSYVYAKNTPLVVPVLSGVLANDTDPNGSNLVAVLVGSPTHGNLSLNGDGSFTYTPFTNSTSADSFTYLAADGLTNSSLATVTLTDALVGTIFSDDFTRGSDPGPLTPWVLHSNNWTVTGGLLVAGMNPTHTYGNVYLTNNWTNTYVQGQLQFSGGAFGGGIGGRLNTNTGAHYTAWIYPDNSPVSPRTLSLIKFSDWSTWGYNGNNQVAIQSVSLPVVGTNWHTVKLAFSGNRIAVYFDGNQVLSAIDADSDNAPLGNGGVSLDMWTDATQYTMSVDNVTVGTLAVENSYSVFSNATLNVSAPGVLANDTEVYGGSLTAALVSGPANGTLTLNSDGSFTYTPTNSATLDTFVYQANDGGTNLGTATVTINHVLNSQTISFGSLPGKTYGNASFGVSATASSGLPVTFSIVSGPATIAGTNVTITGAGTVTVRAAQAGNAAFSSAPNVDQSFVVSPAVLGVTANPTNRLYGATNPVFTASYSGFVNGDTTNVLSGSPSLTTTATTNSVVGTYTITAAQGGLTAANYNFSFTNGTLTVGKATLGVTANPTNRLYGQTNPVFTASYSGFVNGDTTNVLSGSPSLTTTATTNSVVGPYTITAALGGLTAANYNFNFTNGTLTVGKATLGVTANPTNRLYGQTNPVFTASYSGFVNGDTTNVLSGTPSLTTTATTNSVVGPYTITALQGGLTAANYNFSFTNGTLTVGKATLGVTANPTNRLYGATNPVFTASYSGFLNGDTVSVLSGSPSLTTAADTNSPVGPYQITAGPGNLSATNYIFSYTNGTMTIGAALLGVTANPTNRLYGATNPVFTASYSGFLNGDTIGVLSGSPSLTTSATTNSAVGPYQITAGPGNLSATNYIFSYTNGTMTVGAALLGVTANPTNRLYGQANPVFTASYSGFLNGDTIGVLSGSPSLATAADTNSPVGPYQITAGSGNLSATNYIFSYTNGTMTVGAALLGVTANPTNRLYGQTNPVFTASYSGFLNGDTIGVLSGSPSLTTGATTNSPVGPYQITAGPGNLSATNYIFSYTNGTMTVGAALLGVTANPTNRLYGQANPVFTASYSGFLNGDTVGVLSGSPSLTTLADTNSPVGPYQITAGPGNLSATNYIFSYTNGTMTVGAALLGVTANPTNRLYGATNPVFTASYSGFLNGDTIGVLSGSPLLTTAADTNSAVGPYQITAGPGNLSATNYIFSYTNGTMTVGAALLGVTANPTNRLYGATNPVFAASYSGFLNGDTVSVLSGGPSLTTSATTNSPVGPYQITAGPGNLSATNYIFSYTNGTMTVGAALLGVTANPTNRLYGQTNPVFTASYSGFLNGDTVSVLSGGPSLTTSATTNSPVGPYQITAGPGNLSATNYIFSYTNGTMTVGAALLGVTANPTNRLYGATNPVFAASCSGFLNGDTVSVLSGSPSLTTVADTNSPVGPYQITAGPGNLSATNYIFSYTNGTMTVGAALLGVTANPTNRLYGQTNPVFTASYSGFLNGDTVSVLSGGPSLTTSATTNSPVGPYQIPAGPGNLSATNYIFSYTNGTMTVGAALLGVTANPTNRLYGATNPVFAASYSGFLNGDTVSVLSGSPSLTTLADTNSPVGPYQITAGPGNLSATNYIFSYTNGTMTVGAALLGVTANPTNRLYGQTNPVFTASYSGFLNGDTVSVLSGGPSLTTSATTNSPVGPYQITAGPGNLSATNYIFSYTNGTMTVGAALLGVTANPTNRLYGATNPVFTASYSGFLNGDTLSVLSGSPSLTTVADTNSPVGPYQITAGPGNLSATNYIFSYTNGTMTVGAALLGVTANPTNRLYGQTNPVFAASYSGFLNGDTVSVLSGGPSLTTSATTNSPVGPYQITAGPGNLSATNYIFSYTNGTMTVGAALLGVTANPTNRLYGQTNPVFTASYSGFLNGDTVSVLSGGPSLTTSATTNSPVGPYQITAGPGNLSATNYIFSYTNGTMTVGAALLGVTANPTNRLYGQTNPVFTASYSGFLNGDTVSVLSGGPSLTTSATTNSPVGPYQITAGPGNLSATNYIFSYTNGTMTVGAALLGVTANPTNRLYGATNPVFTASCSGFLNGDTLSVLSGSPSLTTAADTNSPVGPYQITAGPGNLSATNYIFSYTNGTMTVGAALLGVTANPTNRLYGQTNPVFTASYSGFLNGDTVSVLSGGPSLTTSATTNSPVGPYQITAGPGNLSATNYIFSYTNGTMTVGAALLGVTANPTNRLYGATNPVFTASYSGFLNGDTLSVLSGSPSLTTVADTNSPVGPYQITAGPGNLSATNYIFSYTNGTMTVGAALLGVTANPTNRLYGQTNPVFAASYSGFLNGDTIGVLSGSPSLTTSATTNSPVGPYQITAGPGNLSATNYIFSYTNGTMTVGAALLGVTANPTNRLYGATNPVFTASYSGFLNGDTLSVLSGSPSLTTVADTNSPVGPYQITAGPGNLSATNYIFSYTNGTMTVGAALLGVTANPTNRLYGATNPVFTASYSGFLNGDTIGVLSGSPSLTTVADTNSPVGPYQITPGPGNLSATNYIFSYTNGTMTVGAALLGVTANPTNRLYGATNPVFTASYSGFLNGDTVSVLSGSPSLTTGATTNSAVGPYQITAGPGNLSATNYIFSYTNGTMTVGAALLGVTANPTNRLYGQANPVFTASYSGFLNGDTIGVLSGSPSLTAAADTNSPVGPYQITPGPGNLSATNYIFSYTNGTLTVGQASLIVSADNKSRPFGAANPVLTASYSGFVNGETTNVLGGGPSLTTTADTSSPAGTYAIVATNGTLASSNYAFTFVNGVLTVTSAAPIVVSIANASATNVVINWTATSNVIYRVQYVPDILSTNWQSLVPDITATNTTASTVDNPGNAVQRFYRVIIP